MYPFPTTLLRDEAHGSHQTPEVPTAPEGQDASSVSSHWSLHGFQPLAPKDRAPPANKCADCLQEPRNLASCAGSPLINPGCKWPFPVALSLLYDTLTGEWWARGPALDWLHLSALCERTTTIRPHFTPDLEAEVGHLPGPGLKSAGLSWLPCSSHLPIGPSLGLSCVSYPSLGGFVVGNVTPVSCSPCSLKHSLPKICIELCFHWSIHQSPISLSNRPPASYPCTTQTSLHPPNHPPVIHSSTQLSIHPSFIYTPIHPSTHKSIYPPPIESFVHPAVMGLLQERKGDRNKTPILVTSLPPLPSGLSPLASTDLPAAH